MATEERNIQETILPDGTRIITTTIIQRIPPMKAPKINQIDLEVEEDFDQQALIRTNELRAKHGAPPLAMSKELCDWAQEWANELAVQKICEHRPKNRYGENLYYRYDSTGATVYGRVPVQEWYDEIKDYSYFGGEPPRNAISQVGHFTQLIWKGTKEMGIAKAQNGNWICVVANYNPPGNVLTRFAQNVLPIFQRETSKKNTKQK